MMSTSTTSKIITGGVLALGILAASPFVPATFAEEGESNATPTVKVGVNQEDIYTASSCKTNTANTVKYCADGNKLTFTNYDDGVVKITDLDNVNVNFSGTNKFKPEIKQSGTATYHGTIFSFSGDAKPTVKTTVSGEEGSKVVLAQPTVTVGSNKSLGFFNNYKTLTFENIAMDMDVSFLSESDRTNSWVFIPNTTSDTTIKSGQIVAKKFGTLILDINNESTFVVNDGKIDTDGTVSMSGSVTINGGSLNTNRVSAHYGGFTINGGELTINETKTTTGGALMSYKFVHFLSGTTKITAPAGVDLVYASGGELTFGEDVCVSGDVTVDTTRTPSIRPNDRSKPGEVTIAKGNCPVNPTPGEDGQDNGTKVPNTGFASSAAILGTIIAVPGIVAAAILGRKLYQRYSHRVSFKK